MARRIAVVLGGDVLLQLALFESPGVAYLEARQIATGGQAVDGAFVDLEVVGHVFDGQNRVAHDEKYHSMSKKFNTVNISDIGRRTSRNAVLVYLRPQILRARFR